MTSRAPVGGRPAVEWRLLYTGAHPGALNMGIDEAILHSVASGGPPTLRFYGWNPHALSLGCFQDAAEVDLDACRRLGVDVVRRPTGGRAVLHGVEVTYSLVLPEASGIVPQGITESYRAISRGLARGLASLGLETRLAEGRQRTDAPGRRGLSAACFDAPSWYELNAGGKKLVGSAQVRRFGVLLQHGSIPLALDAGALFACLKFPDEAARARAKAAFAAKATSLWEALGREVPFHEVAAAVAGGIGEELGVEFREGALTEREEKTAEELAREKYARLDWHRRSGRTYPA